jgi:hypothetical protein
MPLYEFTEETQDGYVAQGTIEALNKEQAIKKLRAMGVRIIMIDKLSHTQQIIHDKLMHLRSLKEQMEPSKPILSYDRIQRRRRNYGWLLWLVIPAIVAIFFLLV